MEYSSMPDPPMTELERRLVEMLKAHESENRTWFSSQEELNKERDRIMAELRAFQQKQMEINARRERTLKKVNEDLTSIKINQSEDSTILKRLASLWMPEPGEPKQKSHAIGTWSGWKIMGAVFTALGGLVLAYQILVPVLVALHQAMLHAVINQ